MRPSSVVIVLIALLAVIFLISSARAVPVQRNDIVERFGKYHRTLAPGMHVVWPFLDRILGIVDLREQIVTVAPKPFTTARRDAITLSLTVYVRVIDATKFAYAGPFLPALDDRLTAIVQTIVGGYDTGPALNHPMQIAMAATEKLDDALKSWAVKVTRVEITDVQPPPPKDGKGWVYRKVA